MKTELNVKKKTNIFNKYIKKQEFFFTSLVSVREKMEGSTCILNYSLTSTKYGLTDLTSLHSTIA